MARKGKQRRQQHGSAWHWKQTDSWYFTEPGTKKRIPLFDEKGERIRGKDNKESARIALARIKVADELNTPVPLPSDEWTVARICDVYLVDLHRSANPLWATQVERWLNDLCGYCGALKVSEFKKKHLRTWLQQHTTWNHNSQRNVIGSVIAAFNFRFFPHFRGSLSQGLWEEFEFAAEEEDAGAVVFEVTEAAGG